MKIIDAISDILKREGVEFLSTYPTTPLIDAAAAIGIRPVLCRQERVGVGIADGFTRITNGKRIGAFAMQYGPGAENAFPGVATAYSDSVPMLILPLGHQRDRAQVFPLFSSARTYASVTKWVETLNQAEQVSEVMRRAFNLLKMGRPGPVMVEIPADVAVADVGDHFLLQADVVLGIGCSFTRHGMATNIPAGKVIVHATNDERDLNKNYAADYPILGDAKLVLRQFIDAAKDLLGARGRRESPAAGEVRQARDTWLKEWLPKLTSNEVPITPYRVIWDFMQTINPRDAIVTHDSGSPRNQLVPFYRATTPRGYMGWGKSHALGTGLGLIMGAKLAAPDKFCVNFMGDAAFGMTGLDFETAVRCGIPITTIVLNNSAMAIERHALVVSHDRYRTRDIGGNYADMGRAMGGYTERVEKPAEIIPALERARKMNEGGRAVLLEFITSEEIEFSHRRAF